MNKTIIRTAIVAGVTAWSGLTFAQMTSTPAAPNPSVGGQASTMSPAGVPNPTQRPDGTDPAARGAVRADARADNHSPANTATPGGQASTMTNNQPNATPQTGAMTRNQVRPTSYDLKPQMGQKGERPDVPTNPEAKTGTPK
jgi:hypothetical protein